MDTAAIDTTYFAPIGEERQLMNIAVAAQDLTEEQAAAIKEMKRAQASSDSSNAAKDARIKNLEEDRGNCDKQRAIDQGLTAIQKRGKWRWMWVAGGILACWIGTEAVAK